MLTDAQKVIVKDVCSIQFQSLEDILIDPDIGETEDGDKYEDIWDDLGITRIDFDKALIYTIRNFKHVYKDPAQVYFLDDLDMLVFRHILHNFDQELKWTEKYPKAYSNLWNKLFLFGVVHKQ